MFISFKSITSLALVSWSCSRASAIRLRGTASTVSVQVPGVVEIQLEKMLEAKFGHLPGSRTSYDPSTLTFAIIVGGLTAAELVGKDVPDGPTPEKLEIWLSSTDQSKSVAYSYNFTDVKWQKANPLADTTPLVETHDDVFGGYCNYIATHVRERNSATGFASIMCAYYQGQCHLQYNANNDGMSVLKCFNDQGEHSHLRMESIGGEDFVATRFHHCPSNANEDCYAFPFQQYNPLEQVKQVGFNEPGYAFYNLGSLAYSVYENWLVKGAEFRYEDFTYEITVHREIKVSLIGKDVAHGPTPLEFTLAVPEGTPYPAADPVSYSLGDIEWLPNTSSGVTTPSANVGVVCNFDNGTDNPLRETEAHNFLTIMCTYYKRQCWNDDVPEISNSVRVTCRNDEGEESQLLLSGDETGQYVPTMYRNCPADAANSCFLVPFLDKQ